VNGKLHALDILPQYPLYRRLDGTQSQSGLCGEEKCGKVYSILFSGNMRQYIFPAYFYYKKSYNNCRFTNEEEEELLTIQF
jgi:hypothetical protein